MFITTVDIKKTHIIDIKSKKKIIHIVFLISNTNQFTIQQLCDSIVFLDKCSSTWNYKIAKYERIEHKEHFFVNAFWINSNGIV